MDRQQVLGWYNHRNVGDEAYKLAFPLVFPNSSFNFLDKLSIPTDLCLLGGGDVLGGQFLKDIKNANKRIALSVSIPEDITEDTPNLFSTIIVRDSKSFSILKSHINIKPRIEYCPDFTFALTPDKDKGLHFITQSFASRSLDLYTKRIAVVINGSLIPNSDTASYQSQAFDHVCRSLAETFDNTNASFIFIPFGNSLPADDKVANGYVASKCKFWKKNLYIDSVLGPQDALNVLAACDVVISTRLHSSIFSCIAGVPFIDILHNHKNTAFLDDLRYSYKMSFWDFSKKELMEMINKIDKNHTKIKAKLDIITRKNKKKLSKINVSLLQ
jgi:polysaccharide pyruvyl transferase WcaK-like protein